MQVKSLDESIVDDRRAICLEHGQLLAIGMTQEGQTSQLRTAPEKCDILIGLLDQDSRTCPGCRWVYIPDAASRACLREEDSSRARALRLASPVRVKPIARHS